jgi:hypothetical protein
VEVIESGEPAIFICRWPGIYYNGAKLGFEIFKTVVNRLHEKYDHLIWMKLSEISRYWAAKAFTKITLQEKKIEFNAPFATDLFTIRIPIQLSNPVFRIGKTELRLRQVQSEKGLDHGTWYPTVNHTIICIDLPKGISELEH